jgi:hypothetical protein
VPVSVFLALLAFCFRYELLNDISMTGNDLSFVQEEINNFNKYSFFFFQKLLPL